VAQQEEPLMSSTNVPLRSGVVIDRHDPTVVLDRD
jgi:hypothetical protein